MKAPLDDLISSLDPGVKRLLHGLEQTLCVPNECSVETIRSVGARRFVDWLSALKSPESKGAHGKYIIDEHIELHRTSKKYRSIRLPDNLPERFGMASKAAALKKQYFEAATQLPFPKASSPFSTHIQAGEIFGFEPRTHSKRKLEYVLVGSNRLSCCLGVFADKSGPRVAYNNYEYFRVADEKVTLPLDFVHPALIFLSTTVIPLDPSANWRHEAYEQALNHSLRLYFYSKLTNLDSVHEAFCCP